MSTPSLPVIHSKEEMLHRLVHPSWMREGRPTSQAFDPTKEHDFKLSVNQHSIWTLERSFHHHTEILKLKAEGIWCLQISECNDLELLTIADPIAKPHNPSHAYVDFSSYGASAREKKAKILRHKADSRGRQFP